VRYELDLYILFRRNRNYDRKGSIAKKKKKSGRESEGDWRQDELKAVP
jgi:hypothetical protein